MLLRREHEPIEIKTQAQIALMREAGLVVARVLAATAAAVEPGISTAELDAIAAKEIKAAGARASFLHYGWPPYPGVICTSVNDEIVHGIPRHDCVMKEGDIISIDAGAIVGGWHGDAAVTVPVGRVAEEAAELIATCEAALWAGLAMAAAGNRLSDISHAIASSAGNYGIPREYTGHFIGSEMHMDPSVPNYGPPGKGPVLAEGMALAIEPMLLLGRAGTQVDEDGWTVRTADGSLAAHFEHTVAITPDGPWVLTAEDGGRAGLGRSGANALCRATPG
jgi:methionyl aminopeptidase